jgi:heat shock protein HslJ
MSAVAGGCGGDEEESAADPSSLEGVPWVLVSGVDVDGWEAVAPSLTFEDGQASGSSGCNQFSGSYTVDGSSLELAMTAMGCPPPADEVERASMDALQGTAGWRLEGEELSSTKMACPEPEGVMDQEAAYLAALPTAVGFRVSGGMLELLSAEGTAVVTYTRGESR